MKIYLLTGTCGCYESYRDWTVCAYESKEKAQEHADRCNAWYEEQIKEIGSIAYYSDVWRGNEVVCPYDEDFETDYDGTRWYVSQPIELHEWDNM